MTPKALPYIGIRTARFRSPASKSNTHMKKIAEEHKRLRRP
jgi:hypothetical protein